MVSCGARLAPFDIKELRDLMAYDEMELDTIGDKKTALFLIMSDTDASFVRPDRAPCNAKNGTAPHDNAGGCLPDRKAKADTGTQHGRKAVSCPKAIGHD